MHINVDTKMIYYLVLFNLASTKPYVSRITNSGRHRIHAINEVGYLIQDASQNRMPNIIYIRIVLKVNFKLY